LSKKISSILYNLSRKANDLETIITLNPIKIIRRLKNKIIGRIVIGKFLNKIFKL